jgi:hypothetical protein
MRYEVKLINTGEFGETIFSTDDYAEAKLQARANSSDSYYGTAIIDIETQTADLGDGRVVPVEKAFQD